MTTLGWKAATLIHTSQSMSEHVSGKDNSPVPVDQPLHCIGGPKHWVDQRGRKMWNAYQELLTMSRERFSHRICNAQENIRPYFGVRIDLSEHKMLAILRSCRIVIPVSLRNEVLQRLHVSHRGNWMYSEAHKRNCVWPGTQSMVYKGLDRL